MSKLEEIIIEAAKLEDAEKQYIIAVMRGMNFTREVVKKEMETQTA